MYAEDSFFTLSTMGQIGLAVLSASMFGLMIWLMAQLRFVIWVRLCVAAIAFWLFVVLSPQIYYLYYLMLFDGLPLQWVVRTIPGLAHVVGIMGFYAEPTVSAHAQGLLGWAMIAAAAIRKKA